MNAGELSEEELGDVAGGIPAVAVVLIVSGAITLGCKVVRCAGNAAHAIGQVKATIEKSKKKKKR